MKNIVYIPLLFMLGCANTRHDVVAITATTIGFEIAENPATQLYHVKFGYARSEGAIVPSNRASSTNELSTGNGAKDTADVLMEIRFQNLFHGGSLSQCLAVGSNAVAQTGSSLMFAKDSNGNLDPGVAAAIASVKSLPVLDSTLTKSLMPLALAFHSSAKKPDFDVIAQKYGFPNFASFIAATGVKQDIIDKIVLDLKAGGLTQ